MQAGQFPTHTLTEDFALGIRLKASGWKCKYVEEYLAVGEAPDDLRNCFQQRSRWAKGHFQLFFSRYCPLLEVRVLNRLCFFILVAVLSWHLTHHLRGLIAALFCVRQIALLHLKLHTRSFRALACLRGSCTHRSSSITFQHSSQHPSCSASLWLPSGSASFRSSSTHRLVGWLVGKSNTVWMVQTLNNPLSPHRQRWPSPSTMCAPPW